MIVINKLTTHGIASELCMSLTSNELLEMGIVVRLLHVSASGTKPDTNIATVVSELGLRTES